MEPALQDDDGKNGPRNEWARMVKKFREIAADIEAEPISDRFARLLEPPPDRPRPAGAAASPLKTAAIEALGGELVSLDGPLIAAELRARESAEREGKVYVSPYNDIDVVAGQGTVGAGAVGR